MSYPDARKSSFQLTSEQMKAYAEFRKKWAGKFRPYRGGSMGGSFEIKDSGERTQFESGMVRDTNSGKTDFTLAVDGPMFERWAAHLTKACEPKDGQPAKYEPRNWMRAVGIAEQVRFRVSAFRHFMAWLAGRVDEDHAAAVFFNINGFEYVKERSYGRVPDDLVPDYTARARETVERQMKDCGCDSGCAIPPQE